MSYLTRELAGASDSFNIIENLRRVSFNKHRLHTAIIFFVHNLPALSRLAHYILLKILKGMSYLTRELAKASDSFSTNAK